MKTTKRDKDGIFTAWEIFFCFVLKQRKFDANRQKLDVLSKFEPICNSFESSN